MPNLENASFPFGLNQDPQFPDLFGHNTFPAEYSPSPYSTLPLPVSHAATEITFGRRLQRRTIECGYQLSVMTNPPRERFARVFGFCMLFEPLDKIRTRLRTHIDKTREESLDHWQWPFWSLGGMGQHNLPQDHSQGRVGNQGTADQMKHGFAGVGNQFGMGPFDARTSEIQHRRIDPRMRITLPRFQGEFYDAEEVELYLQSRGVSILPGQDYLTAQVDLASFEGGRGGQQSGPGPDDWPQNLDDAFGPHPSDSTGTSSRTVSSTLTTSEMPNPNVTWGMHSDSMSSGMHGGSTSSGTHSGSTSSGMHSGSTSSGMGDLQPQFPGYFTAGGGFGGDASGNVFAPMAPENTKSLITLDVNAFIRAIVENAVCLGRTPGFRLKDVHAAFWMAIKSGVALDF